MFLGLKKKKTLSSFMATEKQINESSYGYVYGYKNKPNEKIKVTMAMNATIVIWQRNIIRVSMHFYREAIHQ